MYEHKSKDIYNIKYINNIMYDDIDIEEYEKYINLHNMMYNELKEIKNSNIMWCIECNNDNIIEDTSQGNLTCMDCGVVICNLLDSNPEWTQYNDDNKKDMNRCSLPISKLLPQSSTATSIPGSSRIKTLHGWSQMPYNERSLKEVFDKIQKRCEEGQILKCIEDDAKIMYKNISDCIHDNGKNIGKKIIFRGKHRESLIAACVLYACKRKFKTRSPKEIAKIFGLIYTDITKGCKLFKKLAKSKNMELGINPTTPEHFITRFCDELKIKKEYTEQAIKISENVHKLAIASVHTPLSLATGSIYLMIHLNKLNIPKKTIAEKFDVSQVTIAKAFKKLEPFINILINDNVCNKLGSYIRNYQENIFMNENLKPKFIRFDINVDNKFDIYDKINKNINNRLILKHSIEIDNKLKFIENDFIRTQINFTEFLFKKIGNLQIC
jgi:transcription initiation factor TFIIB